MLTHTLEFCQRAEERHNHEDTKTLRFVRDFAPNEGRCE
jgi:hypothetical protein